MSYNNIRDTEKIKTNLLAELESKLRDFAQLWRTELYTEKFHYINYNDSTRLFMDSIGKQMESIALTSCNFAYSESGTDYEASGTGGSGYDLINIVTNKGVEVKSCNLMQNVICHCGRRYNPVLYSSCPVCGCSSRIERKDTRFGIDAKETIRQIEKGLFDRFIFLTVDDVETDTLNSRVTISIAVDCVRFEDEKDPRLDYFRNQLEFGSKAHCNLLPNSYDYYKLCPFRLFDITVSFSYDSIDNKDTDVVIQEIGDYPSVPLDILRKKEQEYIKETCSTYDGADNSVFCKEFSQVMPFRHKSLGKRRGDTTINKDATLTQRMWD